jgi:hypothetical protein
MGSSRSATWAKWIHSWLQAAVIAYFFARRKEWGISVVREHRCMDDYLAMGVPFVWLLDPATRRAYMATVADVLREVKGGVLRTENPALEVPLDEVFE